MLTPMNHREIEYTTRQFWKTHELDEQAVSNLFVKWDDEQEKDAAITLMTWLEKTQKEVIQEDLVLDYGADCIRLYLMFEKTPKADDRYLDTWEECNLEGCYKFLGRFRRMVLVAADANKKGRYKDLDAKSIYNKVMLIQSEVMNHIQKGNTMPNRHNAISTVMEEMKEMHKELGIGELMNDMHTHEIAMAVPHAQLEDTAEYDLQVGQRNVILDEVLEKLVILLAPFSPILAEHLWQSLKKDDSSVLQCNWEKQKVQAESLRLPIQVNAKTKKVITIKTDASCEEVEKRAKQEISQLLQGKEYHLIYVPGKIINFVLK